MSLKIGSPKPNRKSLMELLRNPQFKYPFQPESTLVAACIIPSRIIVVVGVMNAIRSQFGKILSIASLVKRKSSRLEMRTLSPGLTLEIRARAKFLVLASRLKGHMLTKANLDSIWVYSLFVGVEDDGTQQPSDISIS